MSNLRNAIDQLAATFANGVINAIRSASFEEIVGLGGASSASRTSRPARAAAATATRAPRSQVRKGGRLRRRSKAALGAVLDSIVALVGKHPGGLRAEQIRKELGLVAKELPRPLAEGLAAKRLAKKGQKRATTYFAGSGGGKARAKRRAKK
jgi:hypothetical protein